ncbi:MAG TPA: hypothetical protein VF190_09450 [Rhodothermales bacterium]
MSEYDKELDTRTPEYEKAITGKRAGKERGQPADREKEKDDGRESPVHPENEEPQ